MRCVPHLFCPPQPGSESVVYNYIPPSHVRCPLGGLLRSCIRRLRMFSLFSTMYVNMLQLLNDCRQYLSMYTFIKFRFQSSITNVVTRSVWSDVSQDKGSFAAVEKENAGSLARPAKRLSTISNIWEVL